MEYFPRKRNQGIWGWKLPVTCRPRRSSGRLAGLRWRRRRSRAVEEPQWAAEAAGASGPDGSRGEVVAAGAPRWASAVLGATGCIAREDESRKKKERKEIQEDLWWSAFPIGTEWESIDKIKEFNWNFENLEKTLEEGGELYMGRRFTCLEAPSVDCPFPPSDKIGINLVQTGKEEIVPMKEMKMAWVPYVPLEDRFGRIESLKTKIFTLCCTQRRSALKHMKTERANKFYYCMPYYMPLNPPEDEDGTVVSAIYSLEPPIICDVDLELDGYKVLAHKIVKDEGLPEDEREKIEEFLKEKVKQRKIELEQAEEARKKAIEDMDPKQREAFENIKFYKFYPVKTPDTPDVNIVKSRYINRYYLNAHYLM
ncbi:unnamed protein product [Miscanthus lutarioriparius]|uniref:Uncharacterized protein n=1 Tax=Miscanthus lutarioriparius TaxID=422564 RepID=A0A811NFC9_9POAL|nr:unnamed protein product [Miscanthus lutarioriparius]